MKEQTTAGEDG